MIKKIICIATIVSLFSGISINGFAQRGLTSSVPSLGFTTAGGEKIITVSNIDGIVTKGRVMKGLVPATGFTVTGGIRQEDRLPVSVVVDKTTTSFSGYKLELLIGKTWRQVPVTINVVRPPQESLLLVNLVEKKPAPPKSGLKELADAENNVLNISRQLLLKQRINEAIKNKDVFRHKNAPEIKDWFPKDTGAVAGTFILVGKNLDSITALSLGTTVLPIIRRIKNPSFEAVIVQLPAAAQNGTLSFTYPVTMGSSRATVTRSVDESYALVDQFSPQWPSIRATVINITPTPDYADKPHALKQYTYNILYEYVPGNIVRKYEWINGSRVPNGFFDRSFFQAAHDFGLGIGSEQSTGSGATDASGGTFITANMFVGTITGTILSTVNTTGPDRREITTGTSRIITEISSYLNSNSQAQEIKRSMSMAEFEYNTPRNYTISNTYAIRNVFDFNLHYSHGTAEGISNGDADIRVGMLDVDSDLAFRICSGPVGTEAVWVGKPFMMSDGWKVAKFNWNEQLVHPGNYGLAHAQHFNTLALTDVLFGNIIKNMEGCRNYSGVYRSIANNPPHNYTSRDVTYDVFSFSYDPEFADESLTCNPVMRADPNGYRGHMDRQNIKGAFINLKAGRTLTNDHRVTLVLESIELLGPRGGSSSAAFNDIVRYEPLLNATGGHIIGIVYPEFFRLVGDR